MLESIKAAPQLADEGVVAAVDSGRDAHVKILINGSLQISLPNVERSQIVIAGGGDGKYEPNSKRFDDGRKDAIEVDTMFLSVAVGDKASLELVD